MAREPLEFEGKVLWVTEKSRLVELTLGGKYWVPKKCTLEMDPTDTDENFMFVVNGWWAGKMADFEVKDE